VLAQVASTFAGQGVSIESVRQVPDADRGDVDTESEIPAATDPSGSAELLITTHVAPEAALASTTRAVGELPPVREVTSVLRVEGV
jgi:homoserine dehydrogenase